MTYHVFYQKAPRDGRMYDDKTIVLQDFFKNYCYMATVSAGNPEGVFMLMNGPSNPLSTEQGQEIVLLSGTCHTSMSVNDVVVEAGKNGKILRVSYFGFEEIKRHREGET
jgi:hypothetical protein